MIYPVPQKNNLNGEIINVKSLNVSGEYKSLADSVISEYGISADGEFNVQINVESTRRTTFIEDISRLSSEKYYITVCKDKIIIEASCRRGVFRAIHTLCKLIVTDQLRTGELEDYPLFERRGYIEGFYGPTWKQDKRLSVMNLMAKYGMNTFYYAPKDDEYHRAKWNVPYPENELLQLKNLFDFAFKNEIDVCWCVGPGLTYHYSDDSHFEALINKYKNVYSIGVRSFGLLLDDIANDFQYSDDTENFDDIVDAHIKLVNKTYKALKALDSDITLTVCPTQYFGDATDYYISKFGSGLPADVKIFWTGKEICSTFLTCRDSDDFARSTNHKPLYWDNYPVNDAEMFQEMHLGAVKGRDKELYKHADGLIANVMEYAEASKIPLMTIADYLWNPIAYNSDKSLENAHNELLGDKAELFSYIADHLCVACVSRHGSAMMSDILSHLSFLYTIGEKGRALVEFKEYNAKMRECLAMVSNTSVPLFEEIQKWVRKFEMCCVVLDAILAVWENPAEDNKLNLERLIEAYNADAVILTGFCLRETAEKTLELQ